MLIMEKEFTPYEQALELKELGFNEPCFGYFSYEELIIEGRYKNSEHGRSISSPLYQQAFRWFREKHGLVIVIKPISDIKLELGYNLTKNGLIMKACTTYEEAELACLIKLIEITKNGK